MYNLQVWIARNREPKWV